MAVEMDRPGAEEARDREPPGRFRSPGLIDALAELGAVAEMPGMDSHAAALCLTERERELYDAIAEDSGVSRAQVVRQLAAEGLVARVEADGANGKSGLEKEAGRSVFRHRRHGTRARQPRKA
ncbi:MAG: hypothetical protein OXD36_15225, partial [Rhodobacter sp.]|nr:hypothetical protein [Rhodobacter sp.]